MIVLVTTTHGPLADSRAVDLDQLLAEDDGLREQQLVIRLALDLSGEFRCGGGGAPEISITLPEETTP